MLRGRRPLSPLPLRERGFAVALLAIFLACALAATAHAAPPVWHVRRDGAEVTLFGSVHLLAPTTVWKTPALEADLARADEVWFEIPYDAAAQDAGRAETMRRATLPEGQSLSKILPPRTRERLTRALATLGVGMAVFDRYQPWFAEVMLSALDLQQRGVQQGFGVEQQIARAVPAGAALKAFETAEQQIGFFADAPIPGQIASLDQTLREMQEKPQLFDQLAAAWAAGDAKAVDRLAVQALKKEAPDVYRRLVVARNRRWAETIEGLLGRPRRVFIVVGVGHLVGADSVPALLRRKGVQVEGP